MRSGAPPLEVRRELAPLGAIRRFEVDGGGELWRGLEAERAERLAALGRSGAGRCVAAGCDQEGPWVLLDAQAPSLESWWRTDETPGWRAAVSLVTSALRALEALRREELLLDWPHPRWIQVLDGAARLEAPRAVAAVVGAAAPEVVAASPRWSPPEGGAKPEEAGVVWVAGALLYRLLTGQHPFGGAGLRAQLEEQARRAPPLPDPVRSAVPPGLPSFLERMLAPQAARRPSLREAEERLEAFLEGRVAGAEASLPLAAASRSAEPAGGREGLEPGDAPPRAPGLGELPSSAPSAPEPPPAAEEGRPPRPGLLGVLVAGAVAAGGLAFVALCAPPPPTPPAVRERAALSGPQPLASDCASCHPRHVSEWKRSVMAHAARSPLYQALEMLIQEQVGRDADCRHGAGVLRPADGGRECRDRATGLPVTGSGGEGWCVNCHAPAENLAPTLPAWDGRSASSRSRAPLLDLLGEAALEGISCGFCHQVEGPARPGDPYQGNPTWRSPLTGRVFSHRLPEERALGLSNSGYRLDPGQLLASAEGAELVPGGAHRRPSEAAREWSRSSEACGACHDVRLFGTDVVGAGRGEHFKRLRNAYSEWKDWAERERRAQREPATCQHCHLSLFPGVCVPGDPAPPEPGAPRPTALERACPPGTRFEARAPGSVAEGVRALGGAPGAVHPHTFTGVDVPLSPRFPRALVDDPTLDEAGTPQGARQRRDLLLGAAFRFRLEGARRERGRLRIPVVVENVGAGHRIPAGFSQEREFWVHLRVTDRDARVVYEVGRVDRHDEDLRDKVFLRVNVDDGLVDGAGRPQGVFGADVADGPDHPEWDPPPSRGGTRFVGKGLINFQNGFLRCVVCQGTIDSRGRCLPLPGQTRARGHRYADGGYDLDTGACRSNLSGEEALFETYFPIGALDAARGIAKAPDAIIDTRSLPPGTPVRYEYHLEVGGRPPYRVEARLLFRAFPPFLLRAFAKYERQAAARGLRPSGPLLEEESLERLEVVELWRVESTLP